MLSILKAYTKIKWMSLVSAIVMSGVLPLTAEAIPFNSISQVYFFGDSLTDSGFNDLLAVLLPPGKAPTFTTYGGYTWAQYIAHDIKGFPLPTNYPAPPNSDLITNNTTPTQPPGAPAVDPVLTGVDYACGGSTTNSTGFGIPYAPSLVQQINNYLSTGPAVDPKALYFIWSGSNDILTVLSIPNVTQLQLLQSADAATSVIANQVAQLSGKGAKRFVVLSITNLAYTPFALQLGALNPEIPGMIKTLNFAFDSMLNQKLGAIIKKTKAKVLYIDTYTLLGQLIGDANAGRPFVANGKRFYFTNTTAEACEPGYAGPLPVTSLFCPNNGITSYVFADSVHPTDRAHQAIAAAVEERILKWA